MLFHNAHIEVPFRMVRPKQIQRRPIPRIRGCNRDHLVVPVRELAQTLCKNLRVRLLPRRFRLSRLWIVRPQPMKLLLLLQRRLEPAPLLRQRVQHHRLVLRLQKFEGLNQQLQVVPIHRPVVAQTELLKDHATADNALRRLFRFVRYMCAATGYRRTSPPVPPRRSMQRSHRSSCVAIL